MNPSSHGTIGGGGGGGNSAAGGAGTTIAASVPGFGTSSSAWLVAAKPTATAVSAVTSRVPAIVRRRNPTGVVRAVTRVAV